MSRRKLIHWPTGVQVYHGLVREHCAMTVKLRPEEDKRKSMGETRGKVFEAKGREWCLQFVVNVETPSWEICNHKHGRSSLGGTFLSAYSRCPKNIVFEEKLGRGIKHFGTKK